MSERDQQAALMRWARMQEATTPELRLLFHCPNGAHLGGLNKKLTGWLMKQQGLKNGVPDLVLPIPRGGFHGLFIELKDEITKGKTKPKATDEQMLWLHDLSQQGYATALCFGWLSAKTYIEAYLRGMKVEPS